MTKKEDLKDFIIEWLVENKKEGEEFSFKEVEDAIFALYPTTYGRMPFRWAMDELLAIRIIEKIIHYNKRGKAVVIGWYRYNSI